MLIELRMGTKNLASLYTGVFKADRMGLRGGKAASYLSWYLLSHT